jgi:hypothetical protein
MQAAEKGKCQRWNTETKNRGRVEVGAMARQKKPTEIERSLVAGDEPQDLVVEIEAWVPDEGAVPEDP